MKKDLFSIVWIIFGIIYLIYLVNNLKNSSYFFEKRRLIKYLKKHCNTEEMQKINKDLKNFKAIDTQCIFLESILEKKEKETDNKIKKLIEKY